MLLDAHVHTDKYSLENFEKVANECLDNNIQLMSVSMCIPSYLKIKELNKKYSFVIPSFGIHPWNAKSYSKKLSNLDSYLKESKYIGEIGLDKKFLKYADPYKDQLAVFEYIVSHECTKGKLLNLHTSGAEVDVVRILNKYSQNKFIVHWYAGDLDIIDKYLDLGGYFSIGVEVLFSNHIKNITAQIPLDKILIETDNPSAYSWLLGKEANTGMPSLLYKVVDEIRKIKKVPKNIFLEQLEKNQRLILM
ncbi:DNAase [Candidatus Francisella endociliophora]|uniref:DNAase n=1 Tax=Candidatus Francisella endociliophora TaxID=653937 RepID=A0A097EPY5_9GAMM|nr:TatD family hydrolase [Francisella sp. FSC1006]AIT09630.1 DNAase [Francisella sp. FSC1006]